MANCTCEYADEEPPEGGPLNPPIRYDTTGALTAAAGGRRPTPAGTLIENPDPSAPNPPVRYNNTGALSTVYTGDFPPKPQPVSVGVPGPAPAPAPAPAASGGAGEPKRGASSCSCIVEDVVPEGPEEKPEGGYKMKNPPVRYDTTGALTFAAGGRRPVPPDELVENPDPDAPNPPPRYNTTGALSSCATPGKPIPLEVAVTAAAAATAAASVMLPPGFVSCTCNPKQ